MNIERLNSLPEIEAREILMRCCGSSSWVTKMVGARPFLNAEALLKHADETWFHLSEHDWLEAFGHHPKIGDVSSLRSKFASTATWATNEQSGTAIANEQTLQSLRDLNLQYESQNGFIFIVCATGKSAVEMLSILNARINNDRATELKNAAIEQSKITKLRLEKST